MDLLARAVEIQRSHPTSEFADALARLDPPATEAEKEYLRNIVRRERVARRARFNLPPGAIRESGH